MLGDLEPAGLDVERYADLEALTSAAPDVVLAAAPPGSEARANVHHTLELLQSWLADERTVEVTFEPAGAATLVRIRHSGLPEDTFEFHANGWDETLTELHRRVAERES